MKYIITENQLITLELRRNLNELPKYISSSYQWLNPKAFDNFDEFLDRVIFSATRDYVGEFIGHNTEKYDVIKSKFQFYVRELVMKEYYDKILYYFTSNR